MISNADFPNVFPWLALQKTDRNEVLVAPGIGHNSAPSQFQKCVAPWQDDGGGARQRPRNPTLRIACAKQQDLPDLGVLVPGLAPTLVLLEASTGLLSAANILMRNQERAREKHTEIT